MKPLNLKETALKEEIKEILEELENMYEISELEEQVNNINKIRDYIINLQQENKKYKKVIDKAIEYVEKCLKQTTTENRTKNDDILDFEYEYILGILKEVE